MKLPDITTTLHDSVRNIEYHVVAYRALTRTELITAVRIFFARNPRKKPKVGGSITIVTAIGADDE